MKKTAVVLAVGVFAIAAATYCHVLAQPVGPPPIGGQFSAGPPGPQGPPPHGGPFHGGPPGPPPGPPDHEGELPNLLNAPPDLIEKLKLTDDQLKQMRLAYVDSQDKSRKARTGLVGLRDEKKTILISGKIDQARLVKLDEDIVKLSSEVMAEDIKMKREQLSKLTPEQMNLLADLLTKKKMGHGPHGPKMMGR